MSEKYLIERDTLLNIADAIRAGTNTSAAIEVAKFDEKITEGFSELNKNWIARKIDFANYNDITSIASYAFAACSNIKEVNFPNCERIYEGAFLKCGFSSAFFPVCEYMGPSAFSGCSSLTTASFPTCTSIRGNAFYYCSKLTSISFPTCTSIGGSAFAYCSSLTAVSFPACSVINHSAFFYCSGLTTASFPVCTTIGERAFYYCSNLTSVSFPNCTSIGSYAFYNCLSLTSISFPACTTIVSYAFVKCSNLTTAVFPVCTNIDFYAFSSCYNLSSITLGASVICTIKNSTVFYSTPYTGYSSYFSGTPYIFVPSSLTEAYKSATNWAYFSSYILPMP